MGWALSRNIDLNASACLPCFISQRGDSGQKKIPIPRMKDGMKADPSCRRHAIRPVSLTITFAQNPKKMPSSSHQYRMRLLDKIKRVLRISPATTQSCQNITRAPRTLAGAISAE